VYLFFSGNQVFSCVSMLMPCANVLLLTEIMRVSGMFRQPGVGDFERSQPASPNQMHPSHIVPNFCGNAFGPWNGMRPEVSISYPSTRTRYMQSCIVFDH
jgi:hypothetical protein